MIATVLSVLIGVSAGYLRRWADDVLSMLANFFLVLPALPLLIVIFGFLPPSGGSNAVLIGVIIAITGWAWGARVLRAQTLSLRSRDYVDSARVIGERGWRIIVFEILPNLLPIIASSFIFTVIYGLGMYVALAFLGVVSPATGAGARCFRGPAPTPRSAATGGGTCRRPVVALLGTGLALLNFGIDEIINPRLRRGPARRQAQEDGRLRSCPSGSSSA